MSTSTGYIVRGTLWTIGAYGFDQVLRFATNIVLARLLLPELFGIMLIVNSLRLGIELTTDVGIQQNIIHNKRANDPDFYNTAWTLQAIRSVALWLIGLFAAWPVARFYQYPILVYIIPCVTFGMVLTGFTSVSRFLLQKRMNIVRISVFNASVSSLSSIAFVLLAYLNPSIWSLVIGGLFGSTVSMIGSYIVLPDVKQRFRLSKQYTSEILHFGKWIFLSSIVLFLAANFDRLYLAKVVPLALLGVYGIARAISEPLAMMMVYVGNNVLFPFIAAQSQMTRANLREQLAPLRLKFLLLGSFSVSLLVAFVDLAIKILYDQRYQAATWMVPVFLIGSWFSILANINESTLLGLGKPSYSALANTTKFAYLLIGLPLGVKLGGLLGGVAVIAFADLCRYFPIQFGQRQESFSFRMQDLLITLLMFAEIGLWECLRMMTGLGNSFESLPFFSTHASAWVGALASLVSSSAMPGS